MSFFSSPSCCSTVCIHPRAQSFSLSSHSLSILLMAFRTSARALRLSRPALGLHVQPQQLRACNGGIQQCPSTRTIATFKIPKVNNEPNVCMFRVAQGILSEHDELTIPAEALHQRVRGPQGPRSHLRVHEERRPRRNTSDCRWKAGTHHTRQEKPYLLELTSPSADPKRPNPHPK